VLSSVAEAQLDDPHPVPPGATVTPEEVDAYYAVHCAFCHKKVSIPFRIHCTECGHTWRWGWQLSLHDARTVWRTTMGYVYLPRRKEFKVHWWRRVRLRHPSKIWVCPCCSHDL
jgi:hypothetical protein